MWPWSKIKKLEERIDGLRNALVVSERINEEMRAKLNRLTDRDKRGRFTKAK